VIDTVVDLDIGVELGTVVDLDIVELVVGIGLDIVELDIRLVTENWGEEGVEVATHREEVGMT